MNTFNESKKDMILHASVPQIDQLSCVICEIDVIEVLDSSAKSNFHWQTMKCRLLILLCPNLIASPVSGTEGSIFVICLKEYLNSGKLSNVLKNLTLMYKGTRLVTPEIYKACLTYTIQCKTAPAWNKIEKYFIYGKEFYNATEAVDAIKLNVDVDGTNVSVQLQGEKVKMSYVKLEHFYLSHSVMAKFLADPRGYIDLSQYNQIVHVLPSMKKGRIRSVSKEIPATCPFKDYEQLRRHWKNMYGYSLPRNKDGILYYQLKFQIPRSNIFTYPNHCIVFDKLEIVQYRDKLSIVNRFLNDVIKTVPNILGQQLQLTKCTSIPYTSSITKPNTSLQSTSRLPVSECKEFLTRRTEKNDPNSAQKLEFSATYLDKLTIKSNDRVFVPPLNTRLSKIHEIHNTTSHSRLNDAAQPKASSTNKLKIVSTRSVEDGESVCKFFKARKLQSLADTRKESSAGQTTNLSLKEKLLQFRQEKGDSTSGKDPSDAQANSTNNENNESSHKKVISQNIRI